MIDNIINTICELHGISWTECENNYTLKQFYIISYIKAIEQANIKANHDKD